MAEKPIFTESGRGFFDTVPRAQDPPPGQGIPDPVPKAQDPPPDPPPYDAKAAQKAAEAKIEAWAERLRLNRLKDCQDKGDTGYGTLPYGGETDAR